MLVYGHPGVGKTSFASSTEKCLVGDVENGATFLGLHGIDADVVHISAWDDITELFNLAKSGKYETVVIDPIGELLEKLIDKLKQEGYGQGKGDSLSLSLQGWGVAKERFKKAMRMFRDLDMNIVLIAHSMEKKEEDMVIVRPKLQANLEEDVSAMMHVVGYIKMVNDGKQKVRRLFLQPTDKYYAKDRIGLLPEHIDNATFKQIKDMVINNKAFQSIIKGEKSLDNFVKDLE